MQIFHCNFVIISLSNFNIIYVMLLIVIDQFPYVNNLLIMSLVLFPSLQL